MNIRNLFFFLIPFFIALSCTKEEAPSTTPSGNNITETSPPPCIDKNCADYKSQSSAQADYDAYPECRNDLDHDKDGIACEEPGNTTTNCTTTSACGCSGYKKSDCPKDPCCKWTVGSGCGCK